MQDLHRKRTFNLILSLYFSIYFCLSTIPANIDNLIATFGDVAQFGIGIVIICNLLTGTISMLVFGYYTEYLSRRITRKRLFMTANLHLTINCRFTRLLNHRKIIIHFTLDPTIDSWHYAIFWIISIPITLERLI